MALVQLVVDFSDAAMDGRVLAFDRGVHVNDEVLLRDNEGYECLGTVRTVGKQVVQVEPIWATMQKSERLSLMPLDPEDALRALLQTPKSED